MNCKHASNGVCDVNTECKPLTKGYICPIIQGSTLSLFNPAKEITIIWSVDDVLQERPDLTLEQASDVLDAVKKYHDADVGISWNTIRTIADNML